MIPAKLKVLIGDLITLAMRLQSDNQISKFKSICIWLILYVDPCYG